MRKYAIVFRLVCAGVALLLAAAQALAGETFPFLRVGSQTFTNVEVLNVSDTHLFFKYSGGVDSVKLKDLDPQLQKKFGYDSGKAGGFEKADQHSDAAGDRSRQPPSAAPTADLVTKEYPLRDSGILRLRFPGIWQDSCQQSPATHPPSMIVRLVHPAGENFEVLVSLLPKGNAFEHMDTRQALAITGNHALAGAVEKTLKLEPLNENDTNGFYFTLTDKPAVGAKPSPDRHRYQTQGMVKLGDMGVSFAILFNLRESKDFDTALEMMRTAQFVVKP